MARLVSGIQPTGQMHLGNWLGAVQSWVALQDTYDAFYFIADFHALTSVYSDPGQLRRFKRDLAIDLLAVGIDPNRACLFYQSDVPAHATLHLFFSMITPLPWLERVPTYKDKMTSMGDKDLNTYGFLGYPVLQAADILLYNADVVPVGRDQLPHLELTREIGRRFNHIYRTDLFNEPAEKLTPHFALPGLDGRKMSKSYGNTIPVAVSSDDLFRLTRSMVTDPARVRKSDPGTPEHCPVYAYHTVFNTSQETNEIGIQCRQAEIGCVACKTRCAEVIERALSPIRARREHYEQCPDLVDQALKSGAERANEIADGMITSVRKLVGI